MRQRKILCNVAVFASFIAFFAHLTRAQAAGFDCTKASTTIEKLICADAYLSKLDSELSEVYYEAQPSYIAINGETGARIDPLGKDQQRWLRNVRNSCKDSSCLQKVYEARIIEIKLKWPQR
jgi:uncharacterized protein